jgi:hypothetical protein
MIWACAVQSFGTFPKLSYCSPRASIQRYYALACIRFCCSPRNGQLVFHEVYVSPAEPFKFTATHRCI